MKAALVSLARGQARRACALAALLALYPLSQLPTVPPTEMSHLASRFRFAVVPLPELPGPRSQVRPVNPSYAGIPALISSVGAAVALADIDGDGLANDACYVDTRTNRVVVAPVPGTGSRFAPFALTPEPLPYDPATMAPMGCLPGQLAESGLTDLLVYYWGRPPIAYLQRRLPGQARPVAVGRSSFLAREILPGLPRWFSNSATFADLTGTGHLDLVVGNYFPDGSRVLDATSTEPQQMQD